MSILSARLIYNPVSGDGKVEEIIHQIQSTFGDGVSLDIQPTSKEIGATQLAKEAVESGIQAVIVAGGDGTISAASKALVNTSTILGIIPCGTVNALAIALGIPSDLEAACQVILNGRTNVIDVARCNNQYAITLISIGLEPETIEKTSRKAKNRWGPFAYLLPVLRQLRRFKFFRATIETDNKTLQIRTRAITVANAAPPISFMAQGPVKVIPDDGFLDITIFAVKGVIPAIIASLDLFRTAHTQSLNQRDDIGVLRTKRIKISTNPLQKVSLDGELMGKVPLEIECIPNGLTIFTPEIDENNKINSKIEKIPEQIIL